MEHNEKIKEIEREGLVAWQKEWELARSGRWTRRLIPDVNVWISRNYGCVNYHLTQVLTGHGCFATYLAKIRKEESSACWFCDAPQDDVEHTIFDCKEWQLERDSMERRTGSKIRPENITEVMLRSEEKWNIVTEYINKIMKSKQSKERERERTGIRRIQEVE